MEELDEIIENLLSSNKIKGNHCKLQEELGIKTCLIEADDDFTCRDCIKYTLTHANTREENK